MRGPIDFIIIRFDGNNFTGAILEELEKAIEAGTIAVLDLSLVMKDKDGNITSIEMSDIKDDVVGKFAKDNQVSSGLATEDDMQEVGELLDNNSSAGLLVIEHLWAKGLKQAIIDTGGTLIAEGRIHPDAAQELNQSNKEGK